MESYMLSFFVWLKATEWSSVILKILTLMKLHRPLESQHIQINVAYLLTRKQTNYKGFSQKNTVE